jgi:hypothetical protein
MTLPACSGEGNLTGPDPAEAILGTGDAVQQKKGCPSFAEACDELGKAVYDACPSGTMTDADLALCKFYAFNDAFKPYTICFNNTERRALYDCAKAWTPDKASPTPTADPSGGSAPLGRGTEPPKRISEPLQDAGVH